MSDMNFAEVYKAAFAEQDPDRKLALLSEVQQAINSWQQTDEAAQQKQGSFRARQSAAWSALT
jgi:hypothetical protein